MRKEAHFHTSGVWSKPPDNPGRALCLGLLIFKPITTGSLTSSPFHTTYAGIAGGYCGGDLFVLEQFVAQTTKSEMRSLWVGSTDLLNGEEIDFNSLPPSILDTCQDALAECWEWMSENNYLESQQLRLYPYNLTALSKLDNENHLYYKPLQKEATKLWSILHQGLYLTKDSQKIPHPNMSPKKETNPDNLDSPSTP